MVDFARRIGQSAWVQMIHRRSAILAVAAVVAVFLSWVAVVYSPAVGLVLLVAAALLAFIYLRRPSSSKARMTGKVVIVSLVALVGSVVLFVIVLSALAPDV